MNENKRIIGIDIFRILLALCVFLFHTSINDGCEYGLLTVFVNKSDNFMIAFFMMSGFVLFLKYSNKDILNIDSFKRFVKKRFLSIMSIYIFVIIVNKIINYSNIGTLLPTPIEVIGIQSIYDTTFSGTTVYNGSWFVSCIFICYLVYPFLQHLFSKLTKKEAAFTFLFISLLLSYSYFIVSVYEVDSIYRNPFIRLFEFALGILVGYYCLNTKKDKEVNKLTPLFEFVLYIILISLINVIKTRTFIIETLNEFVSIIMFAIMLISFSKISSKKENKIIIFLSKISYSFYMSQVVVYSILKNEITFKLVSLFNVEKSNSVIIILSFLSCFVVALFLYYVVDNSFKKLIKKI